MSARAPALTRDTRWKDRAGREWKLTRRVASGMHDCETVDGRFAGLWTTADIRQAMNGYEATHARTPRACVCGAAA